MSTALALQEALAKELPGSISGPAMSGEEFARFQGFIHEKVGIWLGPAKKTLLVARLTGRLRELQLGSFAAYWSRLSRDSEEMTAFINRVCTNETFFFREKAHFELLESRVIPAWREAAGTGGHSRHIRIWCAACSTGEEAYTLAMILDSAMPSPEGWSLELLASDISTRALDTARSGLWKIQRAESIPEPMLKKYMMRGTGSKNGLMKSAPSLRNRIDFKQINLMRQEEMPAGGWHAIFCRNVLIYFSAQSRKAVLEALVDRLAPGGLLFMGHSETIQGLGMNLKLISPSAYMKPGGTLELDNVARPGR